MKNKRNEEDKRMSVNILVIAAVLVLLWKVTDGYKHGMVKEIISFISLIVLCVIVVLLGSGLQSYMEKKYIGVAIAILLLCILGIVHHLLGLVFFSAKMISKLPVIHWVDKVLGIVTGALETVLLLWTVYVFIMLWGLGPVGQQILQYTQENAILSWLYQNNYLAQLLAGINLGGLSALFDLRKIVQIGISH